MDENDAGELRITSMNNTDSNKSPHMSALPHNTMDPADMAAFDIKPELLDLAESTKHDVEFGHRQAAKACQTEITICDEFWNVCCICARF